MAEAARRMGWSEGSQRRREVKKRSTNGGKRVSIEDRECQFQKRSVNNVQEKSCQLKKGSANR